MSATRRPRAIKPILLVIGCVAGAAVAYWLWQLADAASDLSSAGAFAEVEQREYVADREGNLRAIHRALELTAESEGTLPAAKDWMDQVAIRLRTRDLSASEAAKKLVRPGVVTGYGYALNTEVAAKPLDALAKGTIVVFESTVTSRNHSGRPEVGSLGITASGDIVILK